MLTFEVNSVCATMLNTHVLSKFYYIFSTPLTPRILLFMEVESLVPWTSWNSEYIQDVLLHTEEGWESLLVVRT